MVEIAEYIIDLKSGTASTSAQTGNSPTKKRKLNGEHPTNGAGDEGVLSRNGKDEGHVDSEWKNALQIPDISFSVPQRKKLSLEIGALKSEGIRAVNPKSQAVEFSVPWKDVGEFSLQSLQLVVYEVLILGSQNTLSAFHYPRKPLLLSISASSLSMVTVLRNRPRVLKSTSQSCGRSLMGRLKTRKWMSNLLETG